VRRPLFGPLYYLIMDGDDNYVCGAVGGMFVTGNRSTQGNPTPVTLCPPQIPHYMTRAVAVGNQRLTA
jgi:hypothetical protein